MTRVATFVFALAIALASIARADVTTPSGRLRFVPGPGARYLAESLAKTGDADRDAVAKDVGRDWDGVTEVRVALDEASFVALLPKGVELPGWAVGVAFPARNLVVVRAYPGDPDGRSTLRHELSHVAVGRLTHGRVPRWFLEGLAQVREDQPWTDAGPSLVVAALTHRLMPFSALTHAFPDGATDASLAYAESADFVAFLMGRSGEPTVREVLADVVRGASFDAAVKSRLGASLPELERQWRRSLARWELVVHLVTSSELWWLAIALVVLYAGFRLRRRRQKGLARLDAEDRMDQLRAFAVQPAVWADEPRPLARDEAADEEDALDQHLDALRARSADDEPDEDDEADPGAPKKPTLH